MLTGEELVQSYRSRAVVHRDDGLLFPSVLALEFLEECERNELRLLGYNGFIRRDDGLIQIQDDLDLSGREHWDYSIAELCDIVRERIDARPDLLFEFVFAD